LIVKKNSKGKGKKCKKRKSRTEKKTKVKGREVHKKKGKAAPEKTIQKCSHPLYSFAELYCCLLELGPGRV